jgi:hypothetical protein
MTQTPAIADKYKFNKSSYLIKINNRSKSKKVVTKINLYEFSEMCKYNKAEFQN